MGEFGQKVHQMPNILWNYRSFYLESDLIFSSNKAFSNIFWWANFKRARIFQLVNFRIRLFIIPLQSYCIEQSKVPFLKINLQFWTIFSFAFWRLHNRNSKNVNQKTFSEVRYKKLQWCSYQNQQSPVYDMKWGHFDWVNSTFRMLLSSWNFDTVF